MVVMSRSSWWSNYEVDEAKKYGRRYKADIRFYVWIRQFRKFSKMANAVEQEAASLIAKIGQQVRQLVSSITDFVKGLSDSAKQQGYERLDAHREISWVVKTVNNNKGMSRSIIRLIIAILKQSAGCAS